jgi:hypothetical protein
MYLGQLFPIEDYRCFGSYNNTHNKTIVICDNYTLESGGIKETILALNSAFVAAIQNPFQATGEPIVSKKFDANVENIILRHNNLFQKKYIVNK